MNSQDTYLKSSYTVLLKLRGGVGMSAQVSGSEPSRLGEAIRRAKENLVAGAASGGIGGGVLGGVLGSIVGGGVAAMAGGSSSPKYLGLGGGQRFNYQKALAAGAGGAVTGGLVGSAVGGGLGAVSGGLAGAVEGGAQGYAGVDESIANQAISGAALGGVTNGLYSLLGPQPSPDVSAAMPSRSTAALISTGVGALSGAMGSGARELMRRRIYEPKTASYMSTRRLCGYE